MTEDGVDQRKEPRVLKNDPAENNPQIIDAYNLDPEEELLIDSNEEGKDWDRGPTADIKGVEPNTSAQATSQQDS